MGTETCLHFPLRVYRVRSLGEKSAHRSRQEKKLTHPFAVTAPSLDASIFNIVSPFTGILKLESRLKTVIVRMVQIVAYNKCQPNSYTNFSTDEQFDLWASCNMNIYRFNFRATLSTGTLNSERSPWTIRIISNFGRPWQNNVPIIPHEYIYSKVFSYLVFLLMDCVLISYRTVFLIKFTVLLF